eukprot:CAMPEP_0194149836 /NCGR_PEP_ID=MMETSP0152-20130528/40171_1 /TAXON_ID=1049557 /ORGANISM="Thalassiothrix antarctica, Strain L6-D1" /LENGTH=656 /DNA_ID=CAMNT_0038852321 /DNA_START=65 /DNA_END=2035 /DNA_ORIENTATION=+
MPLIRAISDCGEDINSFLDVAIKDEKEINPIVSVSRVQNPPDAESCSTAWMKNNSKRVWRETPTGTRRRVSDNDSSLSNSSKELLSNREVGNDNDANSCGWGSRNGKTFSTLSCCDNSVVSSSRYGGGKEDDASLMDTTKSVLSTKRTYVINRCSDSNDLLIDGTISKIHHQHDDNNEDYRRVLELEQEMAKIKFELAEARAQVDWYKLKYRHLHVEFQDLQAFCQRLQSENMKLRFENKRVRNSNGSCNSISSNEKSPWFKSEILMKLNRPRKWIDYEGCNSQPHRQKSPATNNNGDESDCEDWDNDTLTTQFCESSRFGVTDEASKYTTKSDKPKNITVRNNRVGGGGELATKVCNLLGLEEKQEQQNVEGISNNNISPRETFVINSEGRESDKTIPTTSMMRRKSTEQPIVQYEVGNEEEKEQSERRDSVTEVASSIDTNSVANLKKTSFSLMKSFITLLPPSASSSTSDNFLMATKKNEDNNNLTECRIAEEIHKERDEKEINGSAKSEINANKPDGSIVLVENNRKNAEAKQPQQKWWTKVKIKKPFGQMHITAFKNNENTQLSDIALEDPPEHTNNNTNTSEYSSGSFINNSFGGYHSPFYNSSSGGEMPIDLSECTAASETFHSTKTVNNLRDYSEACNKMAKRKGCVL